MIASDIFCSILFYETLSKQKKDCFDLRIKAVFIFLKSIFIARVFIKKVQAVFGIKIGGIIYDEVTGALQCNVTDLFNTLSLP